MEATVVAGEHANLVVTHSPCAGCKKLEEHAEVGGRRICKNPFDHFGVIEEQAKRQEV